MILAIETSGPVCGVALHDGARVVAEREDERPRIHDAVLDGQVKQVLSAAGVAPSDLRAVACAIGPGSFTGIRIGMSMAKGLCYALRIPLVAVPTLDAMAHAARSEARNRSAHTIVALLNAESNRCYYCAFDADARRLEAYQTLRRDALPKLAADALVIGNAALYFSDSGMESDAALTLPRVRFVASLGAELFSMGMVEDPVHVEPLYVTPVAHSAL